MTTETMLTDDLIDDLIIEYGSDRTPPPRNLIRAIEQAVLQSPEIQALRKDAELYRHLRDRSDEASQPRQEPAVTPEEEEAWRALERARKI